MFFQYIAEHLLQQIIPIGLVFYSIVGWNHNKSVSIICALIITPYYLLATSGLIGSDDDSDNSEEFIWRAIGLAIGIIGGIVWKKYVQPLAGKWEKSDK